jgi:hypothetical protein
MGIIIEMLLYYFANSFYKSGWNEKNQNFSCKNNVTKSKNKRNEKIPKEKIEN